MAFFAGAAGAAGAAPFTFAHLAFCAAMIRALPAAEIPLRGFFTGEAGATVAAFDCVFEPMIFASWASRLVIRSLTVMISLRCAMDKLMMLMG